MGDQDVTKGQLTRRDLLVLGGAAGAATAIETLPGAALAADAIPQVPRRVLGKTGESIPILVLGGEIGLDLRFDPKLAEALRFGVNYVDAADCYTGGRCEPAVGSFHSRARVRDKLWITTKSCAHDVEGFKKTVETSLQKLKTDYVNLYYLHGLADPKYLNDDLEKTVDELKKQKKIRFFGFSCHNNNVVELMNMAAKLPWIDSIMFRYNFRNYGNAELNKAIDACHKANIGLIAMKTQGSEASFQDAWKKFEQTGKWNKYQAVLKAVWADERITAAVSHMDSLDKLRENVAAALDKSKLSLLEEESILKYARDTRSFACNGCDHICNPAVQAPVQIGSTIRYVMYHDVYGEPEKAGKLFGNLPAKARQLSGVDFTAANAACPHGVDVAALMGRAKELFHA